MPGQPSDPLQHAHQVGAAVGPCHRVDLVDDRHAQVAEQLGGVDPRRHQHDLQRFRGRHQQLGRLPQESPAFVVRRVAVPDKVVQADHLGVQAEPLRLIVQQGLDRSDVDGTDRLRLVRDHPGQRRKHGGFGLAAGRGSENDGVHPAQDRLARLLLDRPQARPAQPGHDGLLQSRRKAGEHAHQTSS